MPLPLLMKVMSCHFKMSKFRIVKRTLYDGSVDYLVERKFLWSWYTVKDLYGMTMYFDTLEEAQDTVKCLETPIKYEILTLP